MGVVSMPPGHPFPAYRFEIRTDAGEVPGVPRLHRIPDNAGRYIHKRHVLALIDFLVDARLALAQGRTADAGAALERANDYLLRDNWSE